MTTLQTERIAALCEQLKLARLGAEWPALAPNKLAQSLIAAPHHLVDTNIYSGLIQQGFRRSGQVPRVCDANADANVG